MPLEPDARRLVELRNQIDALEDEFGRLRLDVHNDLVNADLSSYEIDGFRITRTPDSTALSLSKPLLVDALRARGLSEPEITALLTEVQRESVRSGGIMMRRIA